jgi:hypothetical protein
VAMVMGSERSDLGGVHRKDGRRIYFFGRDGSGNSWRLLSFVGIEIGGFHKDVPLFRNAEWLPPRDSFRLTLTEYVKIKMALT